VPEGLSPAEVGKEIAEHHTVLLVFSVVQLLGLPAPP